MRTASIAFWILAILLSDAMCAVVAYSYCNMLWGIKYAGYSAHAQTAFLLAIPFVFVIALCIILALFFGRKSKQS